MKGRGEIQRKKWEEMSLVGEFKEGDGNEEKERI